MSSWRIKGGPTKDAAYAINTRITMPIQKRVLSRNEYHRYVDSTPLRSLPNSPSEACSSPPSTITETDQPGK